MSRIRPNLQRRALICEYIRAFFKEQDFLEVETPTLVPEIAPESYIVPLTSEGWYLTTSPELHMKRFLAAGYDKLFQFSHCFRRGERGRWHNPEFTLLEWYRSGADYLQMLSDMEKMVAMLASRLGLGTQIRYQDRNIDLAPPWNRITVREAFRRAAGWDPVDEPEQFRFDNDLVTKVVTSFNGAPTILLEYPAVMASLSRLKPGEPGVAERGEVFIGGLEIANAFSELRNEKEQVKRFQQEIEHIKKEQKREATLPRRFLEALPLLPECGGIALGLDRLVMLLCDATSIDEVMAFTIDSV